MLTLKWQKTTKSKIYLKSSRRVSFLLELQKVTETISFYSHDFFTNASFRSSSEIVSEVSTKKKLGNVKERRRMMKNR